MLSEAWHASIQPALYAPKGVRVTLEAAGLRAHGPLSDPRVATATTARRRGAQLRVIRHLRPGAILSSTPDGIQSGEFGQQWPPQAGKRIDAIEAQRFAFAAQLIVEPEAEVDSNPRAHFTRISPKYLTPGV